MSAGNSWNKPEKISEKCDTDNSIENLLVISTWLMPEVSYVLAEICNKIGQ